MKWGYFKQGGEVEYQDVTGKVDFFVPAKPARPIVVFKGNLGDWIVADYMTGIKIAGRRTRKAAKEEFFNIESSHKTQIAIDLSAKQGRVFPVINII